MKRTTSSLLTCGLVAALVLAAACESKAAPPIVKVYGPKVYSPVVVRPMVSPVVVRPYPIYPVYRPTVVYREPIVIANPAPAPIDVTVVNPEATGTTLTFTVNGIRYVMEPGTQRDLHFGGPRMVEFDRGGEFGAARLPLRDGVFTFVGTDSGWSLRYRAY